MADFNAEDSAEKLRTAMKGWGTDEDALIDMICSSSSEEIAQTREAFNSKFDRDLIKDVKSEVGGKFEDVLVALLMDRAEYDAMVVEKACAGFGTNEGMITEILCTRTNAEIVACMEAFKAKTGKDMLSVIEDETSGDLQKVYNLLITRARVDEAGDEEEDIEGDVKELYAAGEGQWGTNEGVFIRKLVAHKRSYLYKLYRAYAAEHGKALDAVCMDEIGGSCGKALAHLVTPPAELFATKMHKAMDGAGTDDAALVRLICSQKERFLSVACQAYLRKYKKTVAADVADECSGDYKKALLKTIEAEIEKNPAPEEELADQ